MPDTRSELNDIILNKGNSNTNFKKVLLAVAMFTALLIVVIVIMSSLNKNDKDPLANTILPPEPGLVKDEKTNLFQSVDVVEEKVDDEQKRLESIANEIKAQTLKNDQNVSTFDKENEANTQIKVDNEPVTISDPYEQTAKKEAVPLTPKKVETKKVSKEKVHAKTGSWYVQVGSFARSNPNKKLIEKIEKLGFTYKEYKSVVKGQELTKLLIGPYTTNKEAQTEKIKIKTQIEPNAFVYQVVQ